MDSHKWVRAIFLDSQSFESDRLISRKPVEWLSGPYSRLSLGYNGYWISVPTGATQLAIHLVTATQGADVDLYANREYRPGGPTRILGENNEEIVEYASQYLSTGPGGNTSQSQLRRNQVRLLDPGFTLSQSTYARRECASREH